MGILEYKRGVCMCVRVCACVYFLDVGIGDFFYRNFVEFF